MTDPLKDMRLLVVSHVTHFRHQGRLFAYGPYSQEIDLWADLFKTLTIAAPCRNEPPPGDCLPFTRSNITMAPQLEAGGETFGAKIKLVLAAPLLAVGLARAMRKSDAIHVRCPGNLGLLGAVLAPLFSRRLVAKYAAQWSRSAGDVWSNRWQKAILSSSWWNGPVTVYGEWPDQPSHIIPFFTSLLTEEHISRARHASARSWSGEPLQVLFTGRLTWQKHVDVLLRAVSKNRGDGLDVRCTVIGDGPEGPSLRALASELGIAEAVEFTGGVAFEEVLSRLERAHVLALVSEAEGWPKAIAEAMAFGLVAIGSDRGFVPKMLENGRGLVASPGDFDMLANLIADIARHPASYAPMRRAAAEWSQQFSLAGLQKAIRELLLEEWELYDSAPVTVSRVAGGVN